MTWFVRRRRREARASYLLSAIVESSDDAILSTTLDGVITSWNRGAECLYGVAAADVVGCSVDHFVPPEHLRQTQAILDAIARGEKIEHFETQRQRADGTRIDVSLTVSPVYAPNGKIVGASAIARDVSRRRRAERRFEQLLESAPDAIIGIDVHDRIALVNSQVETMFGYPRRELLGRPVEMLIAPGQRAALPGQREQVLSAPSGGTRLELHGLRRDGTEFPCEVAASYLADDGLAIGAVRDITQRKRLEADADHQKSEFFALVSHELRTPLTSIAGYTEVLVDDETANLSPSGRHFVEIIRRNSDRLDRLVKDLLLVAQLEAGSFTIEEDTVDAVQCAARCVEEATPAAVAAGIELVFEANLVDAFTGDPNRIAQVLGNLLSNAIKYTPDGGRVVVRVMQRDRRCMIEVTDTGVGIAAGEIEHLFDRFYRTGSANKAHIQGVGLGLAIVRAIVGAHGGDIEVESELGHGTTFRVVLPMPTVPDRAMSSATEGAWS